MLTYSIPAGVRTEYELTVDFDGYLPVLGRTQNKAKVEMTVLVEGQRSDGDSPVRATYEVAAMRASLGGVGLPFTAENVRAFFPKANLELSPRGSVLKTDAPNTSLPIRLPGLDSRRLPEITFLPLEFPEGEVAIGKPWTYRRMFGNSEIEFTATPSRIEDAAAVFEVKLSSRTSSLEDGAGSEVKAEKDAAVRVETTLAGSGAVTFDRVKGSIARWTAGYTATSDVIDLKTREKSARTLKTKVEVVRKG